MADYNIFNNQSTNIPSVNVAVNTSGLSPLTIGVPLIPSIIGQAYGGQGGKAYTFFTPSQAIAQLRGGDLLTAVLRCFNPSDTQPGPSTVVAMRVQPAVQASATLLDGSSGNTISLLSSNYGSLDNNISVTIAAGTLSGTKVVVAYNANTVVAPGVASSNVTIDNISRSEFTIQYIGTAVTKPTLAITETSLTTSGSSNSIDNFTLSFSTYTTVASIINYITATYPATYTVIQTTPNANDPTSANLDHVSGQAITSSAFTVTANVQAIINAINRQASGYLVASRYASSPSGLLPANGTFYLTGGLDISTTAHLDGNTSSPGTLSDVHDWGYAIQLMAAQSVDLEVVLTDHTPVWALLSSSLTTTSVNAANARRGFIGPNIGMSESQIVTQAASVVALNNDRLGFIMQGVTANDYITGISTTYPSWTTAAQLAGLQAGQVPGDSITFLELQGTGLEWNPSPTDMTNMISSGIIPAQYLVTRNFARVVRGISTWLQDNNFFRVEISTGIAVDRVVKDIEQQLEQFIGNPVSPNTAFRIQATTGAVLLQEWKNGLLVGIPGSSSPPYQNIVVTSAGDTTNVSFTASFVIPNNYINVSITATTFSGTITASSVAVGG